METLVTAVKGEADSPVLCPEDSGFWASRLVNSGLQDAQAGDAGAQPRLAEGRSLDQGPLRILSGSSLS